MSDFVRIFIFESSFTENFSRKAPEFKLCAFCDKY